MTTSTRFVAAAVAAALLVAAPVRAEEQGKRSTGTVVKWALIGAAAGAGIAFAVGFHAYDDAPYAESKMTKATIAGAGIGAGAGFAIGLARSKPAAPRASDRPSLWRPDAPIQMTRPQAPWSPQAARGVSRD